MSEKYNNKYSIYTFAKLGDTLLSKLMSGEVKVNQLRRSDTFVAQKEKTNPSSIGAK